MASQAATLQAPVSVDTADNEAVQTELPASDSNSDGSTQTLEAANDAFEKLGVDERLTVCTRSALRLASAGGLH